MASVAQHITDWRFDTNTDTSQVTDAQALGLFNRAYRDILNEVRKVGDYHLFNYYSSVNTGVGQEEYTIKNRTSTESGVVKITGVSMKYSSTQPDYIKLRLESINNLTEDLQWYKTKQSKSDPFYLIMDNSVFVYPAPDESVSNGLIMYGVTDPVDLTLSSTEADIKIPYEWQYILPIRMRIFSTYARNMLNEKNDAINDYEREIGKMKKGLKRNIAPVQMQEPNLSNYK